MKPPPNPKTLVQKLVKIYSNGSYPLVTIHRPWSLANPTISGELAEPAVLKHYLIAEFNYLLKKGATIKITKGRKRILPQQPEFYKNLDESNIDLRKKRLFLFTPERIELSIQRIKHYTGLDASNVQNYILLTNYNMYMKIFKEHFPKVISSPANVQMPALHYKRPKKQGISIINIGVGPSNAKNIMDHLAVLRPKLVILIGHCGGLRNHQEIGDMVIPTGFIRKDYAFKNILPVSIPIYPHYAVNKYLFNLLKKEDIRFRAGNVITVLDRNWEFYLSKYLDTIIKSRAVAIEMESATVATAGFIYKIPVGVILSVSDKPLHGHPKLPKSAQRFYRDNIKKHFLIALKLINKLKRKYPRGLPSVTYRSVVDTVLVR